jgi:predicted nucleotidyltransferase
MTHDEHRRRQTEVLDATLDILRASPHVLGVRIYGSRAGGTQTAFSDVDAVAYLRDAKRTGRAELFDRVAAIRFCLCRLWLYGRNALFLYDNGVRLDLDFLTPEDLAKGIPADSRLLYDPDGALARAVKPEALPEPPDPMRWLCASDVADWYFWMFRQVYCWVRNAALNEIKSYDKLAAAQQSLAEIRAGLVEMQLWTIGHRDYVKRVAPEMAGRLARTWTPLVPAEMLRAVRDLVEEYRLVSPAFCAKAGIAWPREKFAALVLMLDEFDAVSTEEISRP